MSLSKRGIVVCACLAKINADSLTWPGLSAVGWDIGNEAFVLGACVWNCFSSGIRDPSGGELTFSQCFNSEVQPKYCGSTAVDQFCRDDPKGFHPNFRKPSLLRRAEDVLRTSPLLWQRCCGEEWRCCSRSDCLYSSALLPVEAKNNPAPQDKEDRTGGGVLPFPPSSFPPSLIIQPPSPNLIYSLLHSLSTLWLVSLLSSLCPSPAWGFHQ